MEHAILWRILEMDTKYTFLDFVWPSVFRQNCHFLNQNILYPNDNDCKEGFIMEYDASGYPIGCNPPPVLKIQVNAGKKTNEKLSGFYISVSLKSKR